MIITTLPTLWAEDVEAHMVEEEHAEEEATVQTQDMVALDATVVGVMVVAAMKTLSSVKSVARKTTLQQSASTSMIKLISQIRIINKTLNLLLLRQTPTSMIQTGTWTLVQLII
jgi:hypothetical protein